MRSTRIKPRILCVDDEKNVLDSFSRLLRRDYDINIATSGDMGLRLMAQNGPYAVIISDYKMPKMNGVEFLKKAQEMEPDSVRIMLTGQADETTAIDAINDGKIFRFLNKPVGSTHLIKCLNDGIEQYNLIHAEKELLEKTLKGSIEAMTDILALTNPPAFSRATRIANFANQAATLLNVKNTWQVEVSSMLMHLGYVSIPSATLEKKAKNHPISPEEQQMFNDVTSITEKLIGHIPRLDNILQIIRKTHGEESLATISMEDEVSLSAAIIRAVLGFDDLLEKGFSKLEAVEELLKYHPKQNKAVVNDLRNIKLGNRNKRTSQITINQVREGMVLSEAVKTPEGLTVAPKGYVVNELIKQLLKNLYLQDAISEYIDVYINDVDDDEN